MKRIILIFFIVWLCIPSEIFSQNTAGVIEFKRNEYYINIMSKIPFYTKEDIERERYTWGKNEGKWGNTFQLFFKNNKTLYLEKPENTNYGYSWREDYFVLERDLAEKTFKDLITFNDQDFIIEGDSYHYKWKILNEIKEVTGYVCMKAETTDPVRNVPVYAWFTTAIPVSGGPEGFGGLPGMILELIFNKDDVAVTAEKVSFNDNDLSFPYPKKYKGKKITREDFRDRYLKYIERQLKSRRNPYWYIRY
jgi:GLPGLI family protein